MKGDGLLDQIITNKEELLGNVKTGDSHGCRDHEKVVFRSLKGEE